MSCVVLWHSQRPRRAQIETVALSQISTGHADFDAFTLCLRRATQTVPLLAQGASVTGRSANSSVAVMSARIATAALFCCVAASPPAAQSQDDELEALRQQLEALRSLLEEQAERIEALEAGEAAPAISPPLERIGGSPNESQSSGDGASNTGRYQIGRVPDDAVVRAGDFEGSITIPGSTASVRIAGYVQGDVGYDFDSLGFSDALNIRTIPLDGSPDDDTNVFRSHARYTRLNFDVRDDTKFGTFRTFLELDFFGSGTDTTNNYTPVLRHAAAGIGDLYFGQYWSQFVDISASPEGTTSPLGQTIVRNPGIRWRTDVTDSWRVAVGIEDPAGDLTGDGALLASDSVPNVTGYVQYTRPWGRIRVAGLGLELASTTDSIFTGGVNVTGRINLPFFGENDNLSFAGQAGEGFAHYYATLANVGLEGVVADDGTVEATGVQAGYLAYQHWWTGALRSTFKVSAVEFDAPQGTPATALDSGFSYGANLFWTPLKNTTFGIEYVDAEREIFDGQEGSGSRVSAIARFDF